MKKTIQFHKGYVPFAIFAVLIIAMTIIGLVTKGINLGVDFQAGLNQSVQMAYPAMKLSYEGSGDLVISVDEEGMSAVYTGAEVDSRTVTWNFATVGTLNDLAKMMETEGIKVELISGEGLPASLLIPTYQGNFQVSHDSVLLHRAPKSDAEKFSTIEEVRSSLASLGSVQIQNIGSKDSMQYMIRVRDDGTDSNFSKTVPNQVKSALESKFGANKVVIMKTDYIGPRFSESLGLNTVWMTLATIGAILVYATIRFKFQYGLGAVLAVIFDACLVLGFIVWTRIEFNTTTIAAILTVLGYSINDTIVILDRIRETQKLNDKMSMTELLDHAISDTLGRTIITSVTTLLAVTCLYLFTTGNIKDFAIALIAGIISGTFSTMFLATGFIDFWSKHIKPRQKKTEVAQA